MVGFHHRLTGREFEQALGDSEGQGRLACCSPWSHKESDTTEWLNSSKLKTSNCNLSGVQMIMKFHSSVEENISKKKKKPFCFDNLINNVNKDRKIQTIELSILELK